jgi:outer membrane protein OmpA-like peptidoglycan-associated protein
MRYNFTFLFLLISVTALSQRDVKKLESSYDFGFGNSFGLRQIEEGYKINYLTASNLTFGWTNYFTNNKFGGRLELSYDRMVNAPQSNPFHTNYFRSTYYLNASLRNIAGWGKSNKAVVTKKTFWQVFDCDLAMGIGYSFMTSKVYPSADGTFLRGADDILNIGFRVSPSIEISDKVKLFASYTRINHSAQSNSFDFSNSISNTAFKGALRTLNIGIRITPKTIRYYNKDLKNAHKKLHFFTSFDASFGNHFAGKTQQSSSKFNGSSISHLNLGANHKYPNSNFYGRFDLGFDVFKEGKNEASFTSKYFKTTYQVIADMRSLHYINGESNKFDLALGLGIGFATMYNAESSNNLSDIFLNGDDMYALVFSVNPSFRISKSISIIANTTLTSHSLQSSAWNMENGQTNSAFNGRFMNMSVGLRYHIADRRTNYTAEIVNRIPRVWSIDAAIGSHFGASDIANDFALSPIPGKHVSLGLNHPFINPIYFGRFEFAYDALKSNSTSLDFSSNYFRANYFLMTTLQNQRRKSITSEVPAKNFDIQFGIGVGGSTLHKNEVGDSFITKGDDMVNLAAKVVPTYKVSDKVSVFAAYTFVSLSLQSRTFDMSQKIGKTMFNGHLMNASVGVSVTLKRSKPRFKPVEEPTDSTQNLVGTDSISNAIDSVSIPSEPVVTPTTEPVVTPTAEPVVTPTTEPVVTPTAEPVVTPTAEPVVTPTTNPVVTPTANPVVTPTANPVVTPTPDPVVTSTTEPVETPTTNPVEPVRFSRNPISDYPTNSAEVPDFQKQALRDLASELKSNKFITVVVSGHTDITGSPDYNMKLSMRRAANVKAYLIAQGVPADRVKIEYYGITRPIASNDTTEGRKKNRRVDIEIIKN